jgi:hypothetical protein
LACRLHGSSLLFRSGAQWRAPRKYGHDWSSCTGLEPDRRSPVLAGPPERLPVDARPPRSSARLTIAFSARYVNWPMYLVVAGLVFDYARPGVKPECRWRLKAERERMLTRVAEDAQRALCGVEQVERLLEDEPVKTEWEPLGELIGQNFDVDQDGVPRLHRGTRSGRVISVIDSEMQHGRTSSRSRLDGYKLSAAVSDTSVPVIMAVHVAPGRGERRAGGQAPDRHGAIRAAPQRILDDTAYGNGSCVTRWRSVTRLVGVGMPMRDERYEPGPQRKDGELGSRMRPSLAHGIRHVGVHRALGDTEPIGDGLIGKTINEQLCDLQLARGEAGLGFTRHHTRGRSGGGWRWPSLVMNMFADCLVATCGPAVAR